MDRAKTGLVVTNLLVTILFGGLISGWGSLSLLFELDGVFARACSPDTEDECTSQLDKLNLVYTAGSSSVTAGEACRGLTPRKRIL